jgi:hypothetical protein
MSTSGLTPSVRADGPIAGPPPGASSSLYRVSALSLPVCLLVRVALQLLVCFPLSHLSYSQHQNGPFHNHILCPRSAQNDMTSHLYSSIALVGSSAAERGKGNNGPHGAGRPFSSGSATSRRIRKIHAFLIHRPGGYCTRMELDGLLIHHSLLPVKRLVRVPPIEPL